MAVCGGEGTVRMGDAPGHLIRTSPILPEDGSRKVCATSSSAPLPFISPFQLSFEMWGFDLQACRTVHQHLVRWIFLCLSEISLNED